MSNDKIIIKNLLLRGIVGVNDSEREAAQDILINVELFTDLSQAAISDRVEDSIDYHALSHKITAHVEKTHPFTVEALAGGIAQLCLEERGAIKVRVRVEKPQALPSADSAGVEIVREQEN